MTSRQLEIIQHALGCDQHGQTSYRTVPAHPDHFPYHRNHFCAGGADEADCRELVALGFMKQHETTKWLPYFNCSVTEAGIKAMKELSPPAPKLTPGRKRYIAYLDADCGRSFIEWLKDQRKGEREYAGK